MSTELFYLVLTAILTGFLWIPFVIGLVGTRGLLTPKDYKVAPTSPLPHWVNRANRAHQNAVESFAPFAAIVLVGAILDVSSPITIACTAIFFFARLGHAIAHISGFSKFMARTVLFSISSTAFGVLAIETLRLGMQV
ncbi:MAG: MAPEG family protein [Cyanobacteria bacterium SBLK]|nr:MAPEG family protein [Cyanobacteria bacterium SBLK]